MRGDKEQKCLEFAKNNYKFEKLYGFSMNDEKEFENCLFSAKSNPELSSFPDFVCENGFIEHFQISSGKNTKKGSQHLKERHNYEEQIDRAVNQSDIQNAVSKNFSFSYPPHSYQNLVDSFKKTWESHILSLERYEGNKKIPIFLIEYTDATIDMKENIYSAADGLSFGDLKEPKHLHTYSLVHDKDMLDYIFQYKDKVKYVIYVSHIGVEIINVENIPLILNMISFPYYIAATSNVRHDYIFAF